MLRTASPNPPMERGISDSAGDLRCCVVYAEDYWLVHSTPPCCGHYHSLLICRLTVYGVHVSGEGEHDNETGQKESLQRLHGDSGARSGRLYWLLMLK
jgi:hypothetical protein